MRNIVCGIAFLGMGAKATDLIDAMKHDIRLVTGAQFPAQITKMRDTNPAAVWYFWPNESADRAFLPEMNEFAINSKGMVTVAAVDCSVKSNKGQCDSAGAVRGGEPSITMYPTNPMPQFKYEGTRDVASIKKRAFKMILGDNITVFEDKEMKGDNGELKMVKAADRYKEFTKKRPTTPKFILFSDKKAAPVILKALSKDQVFHRTIDFGFVSKELTPDLVTEAGAGKKKLPAVMLISKGKKEWYKEKDLSFKALYDWINLYSESGMGDTVKGGAEAQAADSEMEEVEVERVRELTGKSARELCFGQKSVCGVFVCEGKIPEKDVDMLVGFESKFAPKSDRGIKYNWMWLDIAQEPEFLKALTEGEEKNAEKEGRDAEKIKYPTMIFIKPPKKKREEKLLSYIKIDNEKEVDEDAVISMTDRIAGGATYIRTDLPAFAKRTKPKKAKKDEL